MLRNRIRVVSVAIASLATAGALAQTPFTYQGQLKQNGQPFNGFANVTFGLYDSAAGSGFIGDEVHNGVSVSNGLFAVEVGGDLYTNWDGLFTTDLWLEVSVNGTALSPRQKITAAPRAITAKSLLLPFDSSCNNYSSIPVFHICNQGTGDGVSAETMHSGANAIVGHNSATAGGGSGLLGISESQGGYAIRGVHNATNGLAIGGNFVTLSPYSYGVLSQCLFSGAVSTSLAGEFENYATDGFATGVQGVSSSRSNGFGVRGWHSANTGFGVGTYGLSSSPQGFGGYFENNAPGGGIGLRVVGTAQVDVLQILGGSDLSEGFDVAGDEIQPGMVVSIDPTNPGKVAISASAYDKKVAGIVSGAGGVNVGLIMGQAGSLASGRHPIALSGRVYCYVDATNSAIEPGDLLTTSTTRGHAMKATDFAAAQGAIIGKAMSSLAVGEKGLVLVLVNLQ